MIGALAIRSRSSRSLTSALLRRAYAAEIGPGRPIVHMDAATQAAILAAADRDFVEGIRWSLGTAVVLLAAVFAAGFAASTAALAAIVARLPATYLWWAIYGFGVSVNVLSLAVLNDGFRKELAGRANTAVNLAMFIGSFAAQWGVGLVVDGARAALGLDTAGGLKLAFTLALALNVATLAWFAMGWRREGARPLAEGKV